jgi:RNA polymerase sigma factor (TIGR02999 family)
LPARILRTRYKAGMTENDSAGEITALLARSEQGEPGALDRIFHRVYPELRKLAGSQLARGENTLTPTALVHEAYLRLLGAQSLSLVGRRHFFACAAKAMRNIVIDHMRARGAAKRGGGIDPVTLDGVGVEAPAFSAQLIDLDAALDALDEISPRQREVVELHFFAGLTHPEIAELLGCVERTVLREWQRARAFLHARLQEAD